MKIKLLKIFACLYLLVLPSYANASMDVWVDSGDIKVRQLGDYTGTGQQTVSNIDLEAAKNEFEPFQLFVHAGGEDLVNVDVTVSDLTDGENIIPASAFTIYKEGYTYVADTLANTDLQRKTRSDYVAGYMSDILYPKVDPLFHETRNSFPFAVANDKVQGIWVDLATTTSTPAGRYIGTYTVTASGQAPVTGNISLTVWNFALPSTASQKNLFVIGDSQLEHGHLGTWYQQSAAWTANMEALYIKAMLYDRMAPSIKAGGVYFTTMASDGTTTFTSNFLTAYKAALDGTAISSGTYAGAKIPAIDIEGANGTLNTSRDTDAVQHIKYLQSWWDYFKANGWDPLHRLYAYLLDEPNGTTKTYRGATYSDYQIETLKAADMYAVNTGGEGRWRNSFATVSRNSNNPQRLSELIVPTQPYLSLDTTGFWCPVMTLYEYYTPQQAATIAAGRSSYPDFNNWPNENHWSYFSNMNYNVPTGGYGQVDATTDAPAFWTRAMGWIAWSYRTTGTLYYYLNQSSEKAEPFVETFWRNNTVGAENLGVGGGTFFYPGVASKVGKPNLPASTPEIGGIHDIPLDTMRSKLWRQSQEDHEYMELLRQAGKTTEVDNIVNSLYAHSSNFIYAGHTMTGVNPYSPYYSLVPDINNIYNARKALAGLLETSTAYTWADFLSLVASWFRQSGQDLNHDNIVNAKDLGIMMSK